MPEQQPLELLYIPTYLAMIKNSVGSHAYRTFYANVDGKKKDIVGGGNLGCGFFVTHILYFFRLVKEPHLTVAGTVRDLEASGWMPISKPRTGCVLVWEAVKGKSGEHGHIGFYVGANKAVSNSSAKGMPQLHHWTYGKVGKKPKRAVVSMWWNEKLDPNAKPVA